jgi:HK97 family phage prohead protease
MKSVYIDLECGGMVCTKTDTCELIKAADSSDIVLLVSTQTEDSDGDIVYQGKNKNGAGWVLDKFNNSPVITWQHDLWVPNLSGPRTRAKVQKTENKGRGLHLNPLVFDEGDAFAMELEGKIRRGVLTESSVGFKAMKRDRRQNDEGQTIGLNIWESELIETAIVNRGANPETEVLAKRLLGKAPIAIQVESGGSPEIDELKDEIEHLAAVVKMLGNEMKAIGDSRDSETHELMMMVEREKKAKLDVNNAASEILKALESGGMKRNSN